ncbi:Fe-S cluster assembly protein SufD [Jannaschia pohangensis]|uniref:Fe-S cluster assembly protein SufD n=2 Tax=Jannaschia pohangensis TaxID=390807 RepID=A0A1I3GDY5_9RHOB|nr:Fe-S cluster assembly protein SufD [Jannaschia pohangensis]
MVADPKKNATDERLASLTLPQESGWLGSARQNALARVKATGLPGRRDEYWRYTNPAALVQADPGTTVGTPQADPFDAIEAVVIMVEDDRVTLTEDLPEGLEIMRLSDAGKADIHWARDIYGVLEMRGSGPVPRPLAMLNTAFATDGVVIRATGKIARPVHIRTVGKGDLILHHVVRVEAGASLTLLKSGTSGARANTVTEVDIGEGGALHHLRIQGPDHHRHVNTHVFVRQAAETTFKSFTLSANGQMTRNEAVIELTGDNAVSTTACAAFGKGDFHHDDTVFVTHDAVNCQSRQVFKKVLRDGATGVFQGKILVKEGAQKTDGYQISQALLLDDDSQFLAKPELEIYADDVACSHGSTTGAIDETALFYLRSRGVPKRVATDLLVLSFLAEAVEEIEDDGLREHVGACLADWLSQG